MFVYLFFFIWYFSIVFGLYCWGNYCFTDNIFLDAYHQDYFIAYSFIMLLLILYVRYRMASDWYMSEIISVMLYLPRQLLEISVHFHTVFLPVTVYYVTITIVKCTRYSSSHYSVEALCHYSHHKWFYFVFYGSITFFSFSSN